MKKPIPEKPEKKEKCIQTDQRMLAVLNPSSGSTACLPFERKQEITIDDVPAQVKMQIIQRALKNRYYRKIEDKIVSRHRMAIRNGEMKQKRALREMVREVAQRDKTECQKRDVAALFSSNISMRKWENMRRKQYGYYQDSPRKKSHVSALEKYNFDRSLVDEHLRNLNKGLDLGKAMNQKWTQLAKQAKLTNAAGKSVANAGQVVSVMVTDANRII